MEHPEEYYAVIFTSRHSGRDLEGYSRVAARMEELAKAQPGFLGVETVRGEEGVGITVSYWRDGEAIRNWKENAEHLLAQELGRETWYESYSLRIAKVLRETQYP